MRDRRRRQLLDGEPDELPRLPPPPADRRAAELPPLVAAVHEPEPADHARTEVRTQDDHVGTAIKVLVILGVLFLAVHRVQALEDPDHVAGRRCRTSSGPSGGWSSSSASRCSARSTTSSASTPRATTSSGSSTSWAAGNRRMDKVNPWRRYRLQRDVQVAWSSSSSRAGAGVEVGGHVLGGHRRGAGRFFEILFVNPVAGLPLFFTLIVTAMYGIFSLVIFFGFFFDRRHRDVQGGRDQDPLPRRVGPGPGAATRCRRTSTSSRSRRRSRPRAATCPSGILLWGPPGTGKTLMAEAVAGETGKPYVFVDPSAFVQTFIGVAPMKIKWLYRKLRKLALRYGGVVVFFDEADVARQPRRVGLGRPVRQPAGLEAAAALHACNGVHYVDDHAALGRLARPRPARRTAAPASTARTRSPRSAASSWAAWAWAAAAWAPCRRCSPRCPA